MGEGIYIRLQFGVAVSVNEPLDVLRSRDNSLLCFVPQIIAKLKAESYLFTFEY